jgi:dTDP-4-amino-4,6-dideoxygalactose transaminase
MTKRETFLSFSPPLIGEEEIAEVNDTLRSGWLSTGPKTQRFEQDFREYLGAPAALGVASGSAALHLILHALGVGPGDEVVTTPLTFVATANAIEHVGARTVLADVEPDTLNLASAAVASVVTPATKVLLPVHYCGNPVDLDPLHDLAQAQGLTVMEDAAHAISARYKGQLIGSGHNPVAFSFYATKNMTCGEGGMVVGEKELVDRARVSSLHGLNRDAWKRYGKGGNWFCEVFEPGFKYNMSDIQASIGIHQLKKLPGFQERRRQVWVAYDEAFGAEAALQLPVVRPEVESSLHLYVLRLQPGALTIGRDQFVQAMGELNIGCSVHYVPLHLFPYYARKYGYQPQDFPVAFSNYERMFSLPLAAGLSDEDVSYVIEAVLDLVKKYKR